MSTLVIKKEDLRHNIDKIKEYANKSGTDDNGNKLNIIAVVKANGYGLGIVEYTKFLIDNGIEYFAVATIEEALKLRNAGIKENILMLSSVAVEEDVETLIENNVIITIGSKEALKVAEKIGEEKNKKIRAHIKIDTGFGRYGFLYKEKEELVKSLKGMKNIKIEGTFTHFSASYCDEKYTKIQFDRFIDVIEALNKNKIETGMLHVCNSSAFINHPEMHLNAVRIGSAFLGRLAVKNKIGLKKIGYLESKVYEIKTLPKDFYISYSKTYKTKKKTKVAIVPVGYIDGFHVLKKEDSFRIIDKIRNFVGSCKSFFKKENINIEINNNRCTILGKVGTFHITCDITDKKVSIGDIAKISINPLYIDSAIRREYI